VGSSIFVILISITFEVAGHTGQSKTEDKEEEDGMNERALCCFYVCTEII